MLLPVWKKEIRCHGNGLAHHILGASFLVAAQVFRHDPDEALSGLFRRPGDVGRDDAILSREQGVSRLWGLLGEYVQARPSQPPLVQCFCQSKLIHQGAPGCVDEERRGLHQGEQLPAHQAPGFLCQRAVQGDRVALLEQGLQAHPAAACRGRHFPAAEKEHLHSKGQPQRCHALSCAAISHNAQALSGQRYWGKGKVALLHRLGPVPVPHHASGALDLVAQAQQQGEGVLGHCLFAVVGNIAHSNPPLPGRLHVDGVVPRGQGAHIAQLWQPGEFLPPQREAVENNRLSVLQPLDSQFLGRLAIHCQMSQTLQGLPGKVPGIGGASVQNHNVHGRSLLPVLIIHRPALLCNRRQAERSLLALHGHATIAVPEKAGGGAGGIWDYSGGHIGQRLAGGGFFPGGSAAGTGAGPVQCPVYAGPKPGADRFGSHPCLVPFRGILAAATGVMLLVQAVDGLVGIYLKKPFRAAGPFLMASIHGACLALLCLPHR